MSKHSERPVDDAADQARKDGLASVAIMVLTVALIAFLVSRIV